MKKIMMLLVCSFLFSSAVQAAIPAAAIERAVTNASSKRHAPQTALVRDADNPLVLSFLGQPYTLFKSQPDEADTEWKNIYLPPNDTSADNAILITKFKDTTCAEQIDGLNDDEVITFDSRNPNDQILSGETEDDGITKYVVARFIQVGKNVFSVFVTYPRSTQSDEEWSQLQRTIFSTVRKTPTSVITENFVESVCKFGSDCH